MEDISKLKLSNMYIDIGAKNKEEAEKLLILEIYVFINQIIMKMRMLYLQDV